MAAPGQSILGVTVSQQQPFPVIGNVATAINRFVLTGLTASGAAQAATEIDFPAGARISRLTVEVRAAPAGGQALADVAEVRTAQGGSTTSRELVVDFQTLRTVSAIGSSNIGDALRIRSVTPWLGTQFADSPAFTVAAGDSGLATVSFTEIQTERLLIVLDDEVAPAEFAAETVIELPSPPADLDLTVAGRSAWRHAGAVRAGAAGWSDTYRQTVDVTAAAQAAIDAGLTSIPVVLTAGLPGDLDVAVAEKEFLRVHPVAFTEGPARIVAATVEGTHTLPIPVPAEAADWTLHQLVATIQAETGEERIFPAVEPVVSGDFLLTLGPDRAALLRVPAEWLDRFELVSGLRVPLTVGAEGAEIGGLVQEDAGGEPQAPLPAAVLGPVPIGPAGPGAAPAFVTLPLARPIEPPAGRPLWFALHVARGQVTLPLASPDGTPAVAVRTGPPGGPYRPLPILPDAAPAGLGGVAHLVGTPPGAAPVPALEIVTGEDLPNGAVTPSRDGVVALLDLGGTPGPADGELAVPLISHVLADFAFRDVRVLYETGD